VLRNPHADPYNCVKLCMLIDLHRFLTFSQGSIPFTAMIHPKELARQGFFLSKDGNTINCNFCLTVIPNSLFFKQIESITPLLRDWHSKEAPYCRLQHPNSGNIEMLQLDLNYKWVFLKKNIYTKYDLPIKINFLF